MTNEKVIKSWLKGVDGKGYSISTDGTKLKSYDLVIAFKNKNGITIFDYTANSGCFKSMTTSKHVGLAIRAAYNSKIINPNNLETRNKER